MTDHAVFGVALLEAMPIDLQCISTVTSKQSLLNVIGAGPVIITERRRLMDKATKGWRLTRRGKLVIAIGILLLVSWLNNVTTPDECKVPVGKMSQFCIDLLYP